MVLALLSFNFDMRWRWWTVDFYAGCSTRTEGAVQYHSGGGQLVTRSCLDVLKQRKVCCVCWEFYCELFLLL